MPSEDSDSITDYAGRRVSIDLAWWQVHVLTPRPKMANRYEAVLDAIRNPDFVNRDYNDSARECFYGPYVQRPAPSRLMVKVVVEYDELGIGTFITAYPCDRPGSGEVRLWTKPPS